MLALGWMGFLTLGSGHPSSSHHILLTPLLTVVFYQCFFFWGGSLFGRRPIRIRILMPSPYSYLPELATTDLIAGALHTGAHLSSLWHCLRGRPTCSPRRENPLFCHSVCEMAPLYPPSDADVYTLFFGHFHCACLFFFIQTENLQHKASD